MTAQKPVAKFSAGRTISAAVWANEFTTTAGQKVRTLRASVERRFKDSKTGEWRSSSSFNRSEIPAAVHALQLAWEYILNNPADQDDNGVSEEPVM